MSRTTLFHTSLTSAVVAFSSTPVFASGFALNTQSAEALGAATAGAPATQATPSNAYFNPASIVGVEGLESSLSVVGVINDTSFENANASLFGAVPVQGATSGEAVIGDAAFPTGATAFKISEHLFAGIAAYAPFGFNTEYDAASVVRYHGTFSQVVSGSLTPIVGIALNDGWSLAAGPRFQYIDVDIDGAIDAAGVEAALLMTASVPGTDDVFFDFSANDWGVGYTVGLQGDLTNNIHVGASFISKVEHDLEGQADFDLGTSAAGQNLEMTLGLFQDTSLSSNLTTPAIVQFGLIADVNPSTRLMASATQTRWASFDQLVTAFENPAQPPEVTTQNWDNVWAGALGVEYDISQSDTIRAGVMYEDDPVNPAFSTARVPGAKRVWFGAGYSRDLSDNAELHLAASYVYNDTGPVDQSVTLPENQFRGSLQADVNITGLLFAVGLDWKF
ncbi:outer membrane protein transport protein [Hyphococcus flavus]|uniref:Outer membrane protein transport protein n=1 Tax=Hyphococcus flavus TaxID=1866326 RepID=A0AAE9ZAK5_9PROT|nr:outer membrane protein transport protein [Hyphococcus flavus]WDI30698.1 outer membrane protein transport protein [Hyphococcus flavus]